MAAAITQPPFLPAEAPRSTSCVDLSTLSQSELQTLARFSSAAAATQSLVSPTTIDPSIFNESTGSHRQTYSAAVHHRRRTAAASHSDNPSPPPPPPSAADLAHNRLIMDRLKSLISRHPSFHSVELLSPSLPPPPPPPRKRGRKPKSSPDIAAAAELMPVDAAALAAAEDPFGDELRRRTAGIESEEGLLGFMRSVEGEWGSRRKRRRIVDAAEFGEVLPIGWRLLLGIRRKEGRAWIYCRRYLSPTGQHFISCKEVSLYLQSNGSQNATQHPDYGHPIEEDIHFERRVVKHNAGLIFKDGDSNNTVSVLSGIENLSEVPIQDLFECRKCDDTRFDDKESYLQHIMAFHQRITKRFSLGSSVQVSPEMSPRISKMDALVEIAQNSIMETSGHEIADNEDVVIDDGIVDVNVVFVLDDTFLSFDADDGTKGDNRSEFAELSTDCPIRMDIDESTRSPFDTIETQQALPCFPSASEISDKVEQLFGIEPSHENETDFDEPMIDDATESANLQDVPINLAKSSEMENVIAGPSVQFRSEEVMLNTTQPLIQKQDSNLQ